MQIAQGCSWKIYYHNLKTETKRGKWEKSVTEEDSEPGHDGVCVCVSALGGEEVDAEEAAGFATAPELQFRGPPQLLRYTLGAVYEDEDPRGELTLVQRVGEWRSVAFSSCSKLGGVVLERGFGVRVVLGWPGLSRGAVSINPAFCHADGEETSPHVPSQMGYVWGTGRLPGRTCCCLDVAGRDAEGGMGKGSSTASREWEASWKTRVSTQSPGGNRQRDPLHPGGKRIAWVTAMRKTLWNRSTGNKPLGNAPFLLELGRGLVGARVPVYKPIYNNWRGFAEGICILVCGKNNPLEIQVPFDALSVFSGKSLDPST